MTRSTTFGPLAHRTFALLMLGVLLTNLGNAIQSVGAAWLLTAQGEPADVVALVQTALNLPIMLLALPAGAWADMHERRRIILIAQAGMFTLSLLLAWLALAGTAPAWLVIALTALLACGIACFSPAMGASIGSTVPRAELAAAVALNILIFNTARAVGPAIGGGIVSLGGSTTAFVANAACYVFAIAVYARWRPEPAAPREKRALTFTMTGAAAWALLPLVASQVLGRGSAVFGLLLGALGAGAVLGAASATFFRTRYSAEAITRTAGIVYGLGCLGVAFNPGLPAILALLVVAGGGWVQALSGFSVAAQLWAPREVVGRIVALASSVTFGGLAMGSWLWGHFAEDHGVTTALLASGAGMIVLPLIGLMFRMPQHAPPQPQA